MSAVARPSFCIGVDVGGTFTDVVLSDGRTTWRAKAPSSVGALGDGVLEGCRRVALRAGTTIDELMPRVGRFGLGTTAVTNDIASRTGRKVGLITTRGFEDLVPIARVRRIPKDGWLVPPDGLIDRESIRGVSERIDRAGLVVQTIDPTEVVAAARELVDQQHVEAIAISFLWSCVNPIHEKRAVEAVRNEYPTLSLVSGAALHPVVREYERTTFALLNAYTSGSLDGLEALVDELARLGLKRPPLLIHSGGGSISIAEGRRVPATLAESGPAGGVVGALAVGLAAGVKNTVACDMGGTSFDMSIIRDGEVLRRTRGDLMGIWTALPMVDIESVTAGGGSLGWVDPMGFLRVGPVSAGARPGPACYGRGGTEPTVTDALVVLGYIDPDRFLGGDMRLDAAAARGACERLGRKLNSDPIKTAWGIWEIAKVEMVRALRAQFAQKGLDPREFALVSMGGCGALFNPMIARELGMERVLIPELTSVLSAFGAASADVRRERSHSVGMMLPGDTRVLESIAADLRRGVAADLAADEMTEARSSITFEADFRFARQQFELSLACGEGFGPDAQQGWIREFQLEYQRRYGQGALMLGAPVELVSLRAIGRGETLRAELTAGATGADSSAPVVGKRTIWVEMKGGLEALEVDVVSVDDLKPGSRCTGPVLVDGSDTTIWIPARARARVDEHRTMDVEILR